MRKKAENSESKNKILLESFKLFACKPWSEVTFLDIEKATGLSRGAILYHIKNKDNLFDEVMKKFIFTRNSISTARKSVGLWNNIVSFLEDRINEKKEYEEIGILNVNRAFVYIECNALYFHHGMCEMAIAWSLDELNYWKALLNEAIEIGEIKEDTNVELVAQLFMNIFMGTSYAGMIRPNGYDIDLLKSEFEILYRSLKK